MSVPVSHQGLVNTPARRLRLVHDDPMDSLVGFEPWLRASNCSDNTVQDRLGVLVDFARTHPAFPHVSPVDVTNWLGRPGYAPWSRSTYYGHLRSFFTYAAAVGIVDVDPMAKIRRPRTPRSTPRPLTGEQVAVVMAAATPTMAAWLTLGLRAGLRAHEIAKFRGEDVDADQLWVMGKGSKGVYLPTHPAVWALAATRPRFGFWFPSKAHSGHINSMSVSTMTTRLFSANGIEGSIHRCRHTYATELLRAGVNIRVVQTLLRHQSLSSTEIYTAVDEGERRDAIRRLPAA